MKSYSYFIVVSYGVALFFEFIANSVGDGRLFQLPHWYAIFFVWYGLLYSMAFLVLRKRALWFIVIVGAIVGPSLEKFIFHRLNIVVDPLIYAMMFFIPFWLYKIKLHKQN